MNVNYNSQSRSHVAKNRPKKMLDIDEVRKRKKKKKNLKPTELLVLVIGTPARHERLHLLRATWLRDVPHIFYSDAAASPQHVKSKGSRAPPNTRFVPNFQHGLSGDGWMGRTAGDYKALHALLDANSTRAGSFKWIAIIDDDTTIRLPRLLKVLSRVDHTQPLLLGTAVIDRGTRFVDSCTRGRAWTKPCRVPNLPACTQSRGGRRLNASEVPQSCRVQGKPGHDGRPANACADTCFCPVSLVPGSGGEGPVFRLDEENGTSSVAPMDTFPYGGYGVFVSAGMLRALDPGEFRRCGRQLVCGPSDFRLASCIKSVSGFGSGLFHDRTDVPRELPALIAHACEKHEENRRRLLAPGGSNGGGNDDDLRAAAVSGASPWQTCSAADVAFVASEERLWLSEEGAVRRRRVVEALRDAHAAEGRYTWHPTLHRGTESELCLLFEALMPVDSASWTAGDDRPPARSVHNESCATTLAAIVSARRERAAAGSGTPQI